MNDEAVYRTAPATPGLLITHVHKIYDEIYCENKLIHPKGDYNVAWHMQNAEMW